jgi:hypothetical protein
VHRVNWLRAKATFDRAHEEQVLVRHEMRWTVAYFEHYAIRWNERKENASSPGHRMYAAQQESMWSQFGKAALESFRNIDITM